MDAVADLAYGLILDSARSIARGWRHVESGKWGERKGLGFGVDLAGKTLGIVGLGDIGSAVVPRAQASKMKVIYHNRHRRADEAALGISYAGFDDLLQTADFVLVTVNLTPATAGMFNEEAFAKMKPRRVLSIFPAAESSRRRHFMKLCEAGRSLMRRLMWLNRNHCPVIIRC